MQEIQALNRKAGKNLQLTAEMQSQKATNSVNQEDGEISRDASKVGDGGENHKSHVS